MSEEWLRTGGVLTNATEDKDENGAPRPVQPDWSLVLGTFHHTKDENFEEFLIGAGTLQGTEMMDGGRGEGRGTVLFV